MGTSELLGGGSDPPSSPEFVLGGGSEPPSSNLLVLGGGGQAGAGGVMTTTQHHCSLKLEAPVAVPLKKHTYKPQNFLRASGAAPKPLHEPPKSHRA